MSASARAFIALVALYAIVWFVALGYRDLVDPDEGRYSEIPREMIASGDWVTPRLDGLKYFEKPPLQYWLTAVSFEAFGMSNATARLWLAFIGFAGALWTAYVAFRLYGPDAGWFAFVASSSAVLYSGASHYLTLDMSVSVFIVVGLGCLVLAQRERSRPKILRNWMLLGYAALAAAVMTKGLIGVVLPAAAVFLYSIWQRDWEIWRRLHLVKGTLLLLALTAPWFVLVSERNSEFLRFFFIHEHFERYATPEAPHEGPIWYFIVILLFGVMPWTWTAVSSIVRPGFRWRGAEGNHFNAERFMWVFIAFVVVFFSIGQSKLPAYILPVFPLVAIFTSRRMVAGHLSRVDPWLMLALGGGLVAAGIFAEHFASQSIPADLYRHYRPWLVASGVAMMVGGVIVMRARHETRLAVAAAGLLAILACQLSLWGYNALTPSRSARLVADTIKAYDPSGEIPVYMIDNYSPSLPFYLGRLVTMVVYGGELRMGIAAEPGKTIPTAAAFAEKWRSQSKAIAVFRNDNIDEYREQYHLPMTILERGPRRTVVARSTDQDSAQQ